MTHIIKSQHRTLAADAVYYLALVRINPHSRRLVEQWLLLFPVTGLVCRAAAWLDNMGLIEWASAVVDLVGALRACGLAFAGYQWRRVWPPPCPEMIKLWGLAILVVLDTAWWVVQPRWTGAA